MLRNRLVGFLTTMIALVKFTSAETSPTPSAPLKLREVIVSHTDEKRVLQLYRIKEDGSDRQQLTQSKQGCRMPACSPDGKKLIYVQQVNHRLSLWISEIDGKNARILSDEGMNLIPSWLPDNRHIVWMRTQPGQAPSRNSQIHLMNTETGESRRLFSDPEQLKFSNSMPVVSPRGDRIAFVSNRSGNMRIWVSALDGSNAQLASPPTIDFHEVIKAPIQQKVPAWSPDGKWIAHWEGVEMIHMSKFTGIPNPQKDRLISETFHVWITNIDEKKRKRVGRGDDPTWSPDGFVTRAFPDQKSGSPKVMITTKSGEKELPIVPNQRNWGRFTWNPNSAREFKVEQSGSLKTATPEKGKPE